MKITQCDASTTLHSFIGRYHECFNNSFTHLHWYISHLQRSPLVRDSENLLRLYKEFASSDLCDHLCDYSLWILNDPNVLVKYYRIDKKLGKLLRAMEAGEEESLAIQFLRIFSHDLLVFSCLVPTKVVFRSGTF
jgi:hypothetical protein